MLRTLLDFTSIANENGDTPGGEDVSGFRVVDEPTPALVQERAVPEIGFQSSNDMMTSTYGDLPLIAEVVSALPSRRRLSSVVVGHLRKI